MASTSVSSFVLELPLKTTARDGRDLSVRLDAARQIYNAVLGECLRVLALMRESRDWRRARAMPKGQDRSDLFKSVIQRFDFKSSMADRYAIACKNNCWIGSHLSSNETQKAALRAFQAVQQYAFGKRGRPRFKRFGELHSVEGKTNKAGIRFRDGAVEWSGLRLACLLAPDDRWQAEALLRDTKYCRLIRRSIRGRVRWFVQLIQEGDAPVKYPARCGVVGLDIGPSTIAAVSGRDAMLESFCPTVEQPWKQMRRIERAMDRSRRATNPDNFNDNGTAKKGRKLWNRSKRYQRLAAKRRERERRLAAERKRAHGELANRILAQGKTIKTEKLSYSGFQKSFGRSTKVRGCGSFLAILRYKTKRAGGQLIEFKTSTTCLSQFDHTTGDYLKKPLSQRLHVLRDGSGAIQRDLYSAFLARHVSQNTLDARRATLAFPAAKPLLRRAASSEHQPASGSGFPAPHGRKTVGAGRPSKKGIFVGEAADGVPVGIVHPGGPRRTDNDGRKSPAVPSEPPGFIRGEV